MTQSQNSISRSGGHARHDLTRQVWFGLTAFAVLSGIGLQLIVTATSDSSEFSSPIVRILTVFCFFTIQSNLIVGVTTLLLAVRLERTATVFRLFRLAGIAAIIITAIIYHTVLAGLTELHGWSIVSTQILHTAVPILAVLGWLLFGPRGLTSWRIVGLTFVYPVFWVTLTLVRGAFTHWYPYPFVDVDLHGYLRVSENIAVVAVAFFALEAGAMWLDRWFVHRARTAEA